MQNTCMQGLEALVMRDRCVVTVVVLGVCSERSVHNRRQRGVQSDKKQPFALRLTPPLGRQLMLPDKTTALAATIPKIPKSAVNSLGLSLLAKGYFKVCLCGTALVEKKCLP